MIARKSAHVDSRRAVSVAEPDPPSSPSIVRRGAIGQPAFRGHIRELDGLRAIAVILVFLNHYAPIDSIPQFRAIRELGWIGVDIFFVISGLLITGILLDSPDRGYYRRFYIRRTLRIFPLYYAVIAATIVGMLVVTQGGWQYHQMVEHWGSPAWLFGYLGNVLTSVRNVSPPDPFVPMWSLHVEEQFYLLFPLLVHRLDHRSLRRVLLAAIVISPLIRLLLWAAVPDRPLLQYMLLPCRLEGLALGGLIALRFRTQPIHITKTALAGVATVLSIAAYLVFALGGGSFDSPLERTVGYTLFDVAIAGWILWIMLFGGRLTQWLNARPLQYIGKISFGLYLLQMPIATFLWGLSLRFGRPISFQTVGGSLILAGLCVVFATLSWYLMEQPILRLKDRWAPSRAPESRELSELQPEAA
ncbi:MAG TPA: acyltransferase [Gemmatimonadaceae bacterium]